MSTYIKTHVKNFNGDLLSEQVSDGLPEARLLWAGFTMTSNRRTLYEPNAGTKVIASNTQPDGSVVETTAEPGEMKWSFAGDLTAPQEAMLDSILTAHDATQKSSAQIWEQEKGNAANAFRDNFNDWGSLNPQQKDANAKQLTRFMSRLLNRSTDI